MRALIYEAPRVMNLREQDRPEPAAGQVMLQVAYSGICGSELSGYLGTNSLRKPPLIFGHEISGVIAELGPEADGPAAGSRVVVNPLFSCGNCRYCVTGRHQLCPGRLLLGAHLPGGNAEFVCAPAAALEPVPETMTLRDAAMAEPAACAVHAVAMSEITASDSALVLGAGPIGLFLVQVLRAHGVRQVLVADRSAPRCQLAAAYGATVIGAGDDELLAGVRAHTDGAGVDVAFDAAGAVQARRNCAAATASGGRVMLVGLHSDETSLAINHLIRSEIALFGVFAYPRAAFRTALAWLAEGRLGLVDGVVEADLADGPGWYQRLVDGDPSSKVLLVPGQLR
jgi:2-desacetyl-2-hydroxyethyl bacteriochlorophyllide A dehydrogenase